MIPTLDELTRIYIKVMDDQMRGKSLSEIAMAGDEERTYLHPGIAAVRDAVLEGLAESSTGYHVLYVHPEKGLSIPGSKSYPLADYIRSLKRSPE